MRWTAVVVLLGCACGEPSGVDAPSDPVEDQACGELVAAPMRRLSHFEYDNTVRDLLGVATRPSVAFPPDVEVDGFDNGIDGLAVSRLHAESYQRAAEELAAEADLAALVLCDRAAPSCAEQFVRSFAGRAYRRPPSDDEVERLLAVFAMGADFDDGAALVIEVALQAPQFLYRLELGGLEGAAITDYELATRLSYLLWGSMPDDALFHAAASGALHDADQLAAQVERMLDDPRAQENVANFHRQWLALDAAAATTKEAPEWSYELATSLQEHADDFVAQVFWDGGTLGELFTTAYTLADLLYEDGLYKDGRRGLLAHPALLAALAKPAETNPIARGKFVREQLLCQPPPPPPPDVDNTVPAPDPNLSTRERFAAHTSDPRCAACHQLLDPIGFGLEQYDAIGRFRDRDGGRPVDASGELLGTDVDGPFVGADELSAKLAASDLVARCTVTRWFTYAYGRAPTDADACTIDALQRRFDEADRSLVALVVALTRTEAFTP